MKVRLATESDNHKLLELARTTPMESRLMVNVDRSPDYFRLANLQGDEARVFVAEQDGIISGAIGCCLRYVRLLGRPVKIGYIGGIKVAAEARKGLTSFRLMNAVAEHLRATPIELAIVITMESNAAMAPILAGRIGMPPFHQLTQFEIAYIRPIFRPKVSDHYHIRAMRPDDLENVAILFREFFKDYGLTTDWSPEYLNTLLNNQPDFSYENIIVAEQNDRLVAAVSWWDQRNFKQTIVEHYGGKLKTVTTLLKPFKILPVEGEPLRELNLRHIVYADGFAPAARNVIRYIINIKRAQYPLFRVGSQKRSQISKLLSGLPRLKVNLNCYIAFKYKDRESPEIITALRQSKIWEDLSLH